MIIVFSILFQIKYINFKVIEEPESYLTKDNILLSKVDNLTTSNTKLTKDEDEEESKIKNLEVNVSNDNEEEQIIYQKD